MSTPVIENNTNQDDKEENKRISPGTTYIFTGANIHAAGNFVVGDKSNAIQNISKKKSFRRSNDVLSTSEATDNPIQPEEEDLPGNSNCQSLLREGDFRVESSKRRCFSFSRLILGIISILFIAGAIVAVVLVSSNTSSIPSGDTKCKTNELEDVSAMNCSFEGRKLDNPLKLESLLNGTTCNISCVKDYQLKDPNHITCVDNKWIPSSTRCTIKQCPKFSITKSLEYTCTKGCDVGSVCSFKCDLGYEMQGSNITRCENSSWSSKPPICKKICSKCFVGDQCKDSTSWQTLKTYITDSDFTATYAGKGISCKISFHKISFKWDCTCTDALSKQSIRCNKYDSRSGACAHSLAQLVRTLAAKQVYPEPCDPQDMPEDC